jgi:chromosome segregation ATPase
MLRDLTLLPLFDCCSQELQGRAREKYNRLSQLSSDLDWYQGQYEALDAFVEALRTDNDWLEYRLKAVQDALLDQRALTVEDTTAVDRVKTALLEKDEALMTANDELQKARATLAEAQTAMVEKEVALSTAQAQLQQDRTTLEGAWCWQAQAEQKAQEAEKLSVDLQEKVTSLTTVEQQLRQERSVCQQAESQLQQGQSTHNEVQAALQRERSAREEVQGQLQRERAALEKAWATLKLRDAEITHLTGIVVQMGPTRWAARRTTLKT